MGRGNGIALGRFLLWQSNWLYARWFPPSWGCAPSHGRLSIKCNTFFPENFKRRFPVETFPRTVIQKRLNRGNVGFRNRPEIEALRVKEANHIVREALNKLARAGSERFFVRQKNGKQGILYVFPVFHSAWLAKKIRCPAADDLFRVSLVFSFVPRCQGLWGSAK